MPESKSTPSQVKKPETSSQSDAEPYTEVVVHPIVLLSVVDHYDRVAKGTSKRVVGTLLGEVRDDKLHIMSSFAVPFEEDRDPSVWFLDQTYHEQLSYMQNKVNAKEKVVGWYSSGPKIKPADLHIHEVYRKHAKNESKKSFYCDEPIFCILEVQGKKDLSTDSTGSSSDILEAYYSVKESTHDENFSRTFKSIQATFGSDEAEEVGTEHLLRDIRNRSTSTLANRVHQKCESQKVLISKLEEIKSYLALVRTGKFPYNSKIVDCLQEVFNELPESLNSAIAIGEGMEGMSATGSQSGAGAVVPGSGNNLLGSLDRTSSQHTSNAGGDASQQLANPEQAKWISQEANDQYLGLYVGSVLRSILTLHDLVNNKIAARDFVIEDEKSKAK